MEAGELRERVTIQEKLVSKDSFAEERPLWSDVATVWAAVEPLSGREFLEARQVQAETTTRIRMRYRAGIRAEMRLVHGTHIYEITAPPMDIESKHKELQLMCKEIIGDG